MKEEENLLNLWSCMVSKKEVECLVLNTVDVNRTHSNQINDHKLPKSLKGLHAGIRKEM